MFFFFIAGLLAPVIYALFAKDWRSILQRLAIGYFVFFIAIGVLAFAIQGAEAGTLTTGHFQLLVDVTRENCRNTYEFFDSEFLAWAEDNNESEFAKVLWDYLRGIFEQCLKIECAAGNHC